MLFSFDLDEEILVHQIDNQITSWWWRFTTKLDIITYSTGTITISIEQYSSTFDLQKMEMLTEEGEVKKLENVMNPNVLEVNVT